jgi:ABC-type Zn uptake system ZnuABC Zn-binding protein ZnuA
MRRSTKLGLAGLGALLGAAVVLPLSCGGGSDPWAGLGGPPRVVATFPPLYCFVRNVGGPHVAVLSICTSSGPHDFDPGPADGQKLHKADLLVLNGLGLEDRFASRLADASNNPKLRGLSGPGVLNLGDRLLKVPGLVDKFGEHDDHDHDHGKAEEAHGHDHDHGDYDPHVWLGIPQAVKMVEVIRDALSEADPAHKAEYDRNAADYVARLRKLHEEGKAALEGKKNRKIVTSHDSLHYFAESFGLEIEDVIQLTPGTEPDPQTVARLVEKCKKEGVRVIATEPQFRQQGTAGTLLRELRRKGVDDAEVIELDPLETLSEGDMLDAGWYERRLNFNLDQLKKALR